jgi:hypothetical protein
MDPVKMLTSTAEEAATNTEMLLEAHGAPWEKVGVCCINMDYGTSDEAIRAMFNTVARYRGHRDSGIQRAYQVA